MTVVHTFKGRIIKRLYSAVGVTEFSIELQPNKANSKLDVIWNSQFRPNDFICIWAEFGNINDTFKLLHQDMDLSRNFTSFMSLSLIPIEIILILDIAEYYGILIEPLIEKPLKEIDCLDLAKQNYLNYIIGEYLEVLKNYNYVFSKNFRGNIKEKLDSWKETLINKDITYCKILEKHKGEFILKIENLIEYLLNLLDVHELGTDLYINELYKKLETLNNSLNRTLSKTDGLKFFDLSQTLFPSIDVTSFKDQRFLERALEYAKPSVLEELLEMYYKQKKVIPIITRVKKICMIDKAAYESDNPCIETNNCEVISVRWSP